MTAMQAFGLGPSVEVLHEELEGSTMMVHWR